MIIGDPRRDAEPRMAILPNHQDKIAALAIILLFVLGISVGIVVGFVWWGL